MANETALLSLRYQLTPDQTREALQWILDRWGKKARIAAALCLLLLAAGLLIYGHQAQRGEYISLAFYSGLVALLVYCYPSIRAGWSARKLKGQTGWYQLDFYENGTVGLPDGSCVSLRGDRGSRGFVTERVYALRPDRFHTFCIPCAALSPAQRQQLNKLLRENLRTFTEA